MIAYFPSKSKFVRRQKANHQYSLKPTLLIYLSILHADIELVNRYSITELDVLQGFAESRATALNDSGHVIGSLKKRSEDYFNSTACIWKDNNAHVIGNSHLTLTAINNSGKAVGTIAKLKNCQQTPTFTAAIYDNGKLKTLPRHSQNTVAGDINNTGQIVGWISTTLNEKAYQTFRRGAFKWTNGIMEYLETPSDYSQSQACAINSHGQIVGSISTYSPRRELAGLWSGREIIIIEPPPGFDRNRAVDINNRGQVLLRAWIIQDGIIQEMTEKILAGMSAKEAAHNYPQDKSLMRQQSFLWDNGNWQVIDGLAEAVNDQGQVVGWSGCDFSQGKKGADSPSAFVWQNSTLVNLNTKIDADSGWVLTRAKDINSQGQIVGNGTYNGQRRGFLLTPVAQNH